MTDAPCGPAAKPISCAATAWRCATPIEEVTATGVRIAGREHPVEAIVLATGFDAMTGAFLKINPRGRGGRSLAEEWRDGPRTYLGLTVAGFPNMFLVTGPGSPAPFSNVVVSIEQHVDWLADAMVAMRERGIPELEATPEAQDDWTTKVDQIANISLFPQANSWYMGANMPGTTTGDRRVQPRRVADQRRFPGPRPGGAPGRAGDRAGRSLGWSLGSMSRRSWRWPRPRR